MIAFPCLIFNDLNNLNDLKNKTKRILKKT